MNRAQSENFCEALKNSIPGASIRRCARFAPSAASLFFVNRARARAFWDVDGKRVD